MSLRVKRKVYASKVLMVITTNPQHAIVYQQLYEKIREHKKHILSAKEALAALIYAKLPRTQYNVICRWAAEKFYSL